MATQTKQQTKGQRMSNGRVIVIGAGHNRLIAACYLARAGRDVLVRRLESSGGAVKCPAMSPNCDARLPSLASYMRKQRQDRFVSCLLASNVVLQRISDVEHVL
ncbi:MAG: hypothetical protein ABI068_01360 [Ktedonobacterales bacterium]